MNQHDENRRTTLRGVLAAGVGMGLALAGAGNARAEAPKLAKAAVKYVDNAAPEGKECDDCSQFVEASGGGAATCRIVEGAISPKGHCIAFSPTAKR